MAWNPQLAAPTSTRFAKNDVFLIAGRRIYPPTLAIAKAGAARGATGGVETPSCQGNGRHTVQVNLSPWQRPVQTCRLGDGLFKNLASCQAWLSRCPATWPAKAILHVAKSHAHWPRHSSSSSERSSKRKRPQHSLTRSHDSHHHLFYSFRADQLSEPPTLFAAFSPCVCPSTNVPPSFSQAIHGSAPAAPTSLLTRIKPRFSITCHCHEPIPSA